MSLLGCLRHKAKRSLEHEDKQTNALGMVPLSLINCTVLELLLDPSHIAHVLVGMEQPLSSNAKSKAVIKLSFKF